MIDSDFSIEKPRRYYRKLGTFTSSDKGDIYLYDDNGDGDVAADGDLPDPNAPTPPKEGTLSRLSARLHLTWPSKGLNTHRRMEMLEKIITRHRMMRKLFQNKVQSSPVLGIARRRTLVITCSISKIHNGD